MKIELQDMDVPYKVSLDCTDFCKEFVRITPNSAVEEHNDDYDICLTREQCLQLCRVLEFIAKELTE